MSTTADIDDRIPLGVGAIVGESFSILFKHIVSIVLMAALPILLSVLIGAALSGTDVALGVADPVFSDAASVINWVAMIALMIVFYSLTTALLVQLAYDAKLGRPVQLSRYVGPAIRAAVPITVLTLIAAFVTGIAAIAFVIPGLWVYAVFSVVAPAVVIERVGFRGLGRSAELTKEYRWPVLGVLILIGICTNIANFVASFLAGLTDGSGVVVPMVAYLIPASLGAGLAGISVALIYARLREIKEGVSVDQIASVFD